MLVWNEGTETPCNGKIGLTLQETIPPRRTERTDPQLDVVDGVDQTQLHTKGPDVPMSIEHQSAVTLEYEWVQSTN